MRFFPLVFCIFFFILICNLIGFIPYSFTVTSQIIITAALALLVFFTVVIVGDQGARTAFLQSCSCRPACRSTFCRWWWRSRSFLSSSRPVSHSVRLFANMLAGHITLNVFGSFVVMLLGAGALIKALAVLPFVMTIGPSKPSSCSSPSCKPTCSPC